MVASLHDRLHPDLNPFGSASVSRSSPCCVDGEISATLGRNGPNGVLKLSDGSYAVRMIKISWPNHVFVSKTFKVTGATG